MYIRAPLHLAFNCIYPCLLEGYNFVPDSRQAAGGGSAEPYSKGKHYDVVWMSSALTLISSLSTIPTYRLLE